MASTVPQAERKYEKKKETYREWKWSCCYCGGAAGMDSIATTHCTECQHYRCVTCPVEMAERFFRRETLQAANITPSLSSAARQSTPATAETPTINSSRSNRLATSLTVEPAPVKRSTTPPRNDRSVKKTQLIPDVVSNTSRHRSMVPRTNANEPYRADKSLENSEPCDDAIPKSYACHFNKRYPTKYDPRVSKKYKTCLTPVHDFRRLKEHFETVHGPFYCECCFATIPKGSDLCERCSDSEPLKNVPLKERPPSLNGRISISQWKSIVGLMKERRGLKGLDKEEHETNMWYGIWKILHPLSKPPLNPWTETPGQCCSRIHDFESLLTHFRRQIEKKIERGIVKRDNSLNRIYLDAFRETYVAHIDPIDSKSQASTPIPSTFPAKLSDELDYTDVDSLIGMYPKSGERDQYSERWCLEWEQQRLGDTQALQRKTDYQTQEYSEPSAIFTTSAILGPTTETLQQTDSERLTCVLERNESTESLLFDHKYDSISMVVPAPGVTVSDESLDFDFDLFCGTDVLASFEAP